MEPQAGSFLPVIELHFPWGMSRERHTGEFAGYACGCLLPLLRMLHKLEDSECAYGIAISFSPELIYQLEDDNICRKVLCKLQENVQKLESEQATHKALLNEARENLYWFEHECQCHIFRAYCRIAALGNLELFTAPACYAPLPLLQNSPTALRQQITSASRYFHSASGIKSAGIMLPDGAYFSGLEKYIKEENFNWTVLAAKSFSRADVPLLKGYHQPVITGAGVTAFCVNPERQDSLTNPQNGYYKTKCMRLITPDDTLSGSSSWKSLDEASYDQQAAQQITDRQADEFLKKLAYGAKPDGTDMIILNGHFLAKKWNEGIYFLQMLFLKMHFDQDKVKAITPSRFLALGLPMQQATPGNGTLLENGEFTGLYADGVDSLLADLHLAQDRLESITKTIIAAEHKNTLQQMKRELLLAQGLHRIPSCTFNPVERSQKHLSRFCALDKLVTAGNTDAQLIHEMQQDTPLFLS